jgi:hypothetical protein
MLSSQPRFLHQYGVARPTHRYEGVVVIMLVTIIFVIGIRSQTVRLGYPSELASTLTAGGSLLAAS